MIASCISIRLQSNNVFLLEENAKLAQDLANLSRNVVYRSLGPLSQLFSRCVRRLSEADKASAWSVVMETSRSLLTLSVSIGTQWTSSEISTIRDEQCFGEFSPLKHAPNITPTS